VTDTVTLIVSAEADGRVFDLWRIVRRERQFRSIVHEHPELNYTYKDGQRPYLRGARGLGKWLHPMQYRVMKTRDPKRRDKHFAQGWPSRWDDIPDVQPTTGTRVILYDDLALFPAASPDPGDIVVPVDRGVPIFAPQSVIGAKPYRATVPLQPGLGITGHVYLTRSTAEARRELDILASSAACLWVWTAWEFWSAAHVGVTDHGAATDS